MKKKLYILLVLCLASAFLAACIAANATVLMDEEFSEDSTAEGLTGMESDKLPEDDRCSDETTNVYDWDAQKAWSVFAGYYDAPEMYCSTGVFSLLGFPYEEQIEWAHQRALQQGENVLFHMCFETDADLASVGLSAERVSVRWDGKSREMLHDDLSVADMMHLASMTEGVRFYLCECGMEHAERDTVWLWWKYDPIEGDNTAYDWDFAKGWPVFVFREDDLEHFRLRTWPAMEFPYGSAEWNYVAKAFGGEEILIHAELCVNEKQKVFMQQLGIPYETVASDADYVHLDMSYADAVKLIDLMYKAGLCIKKHPNMFRLCFCDDLYNKTNTVSLKLPEDVDYMS